METYLRRQAILETLKKTGWVQVEELCAQFSASPNTIRNDLNALDSEGLVRRVRGGAALREETGTPPEAAAPAMPSRRSLHAQTEQALARWASQMVEDGDAIALDNSDAAYYLARYLQNRRRLTVVASGLDTALLLAQNPSNKVILAATIASPDGHSVIGRINPDLQDGFYVARCFVGCSGFSVDQGLTENDVDVALVTKHLVGLSRELVAILDHSKLDRPGTNRFADATMIGHLVVDDRIPRARVHALAQAGLFPITTVGDAGAKTHPPAPTRLPKRRYRIGFANLSTRIDFACEVRESLERAASRIPEVELLALENELNPEKALENAQALVDAGVQLAIEYQVDSRASNVIMDRFNRAGIPAIAVDIPMPGATYFGSDNYRAGFLAGEALGNWVARQWGGRIDALLALQSGMVGTVNEARMQGQREGLESVIGPISAEQAQTHDAPVIFEEAIKFVASLVPQFPRDARIAVIGLNEDQSVGALLAFEAAGRLGQVVAVGQGADRLARAALCRADFPLVGSTMFAPESYGERLLELALRILDGHPAPPAVYSRHVFITRDNLSEYYPNSQDVLPGVEQVRALIGRA